MIYRVVKLWETEVHEEATFTDVLSLFPVLKLIRLDNGRPASIYEVFKAAAMNPSVESLEFGGEVRLDGPSMNLGDIFDHLNITSLVFTTGSTGLRPLDINSVEERRNIDHLLCGLADRLTYLRISGDLIRFETLQSFRWPRLTKLILSDHITYAPIHLPLVMLAMPLLRALAYNFSASDEGFAPPIMYCNEGDPLTLAAVLPELEELSLSNVYPEDPILDQFPPNLTVLRIKAYRDKREYFYGRSYGPTKFSPYSELKEADALKIIDQASHFPNLVELALTLVDLPSLSIIIAVVEACPQLRVLELAQGMHEKNGTLDPRPFVRLYIVAQLELIYHHHHQESVILPLVSLKYLRDLRLSVGLGQEIGRRADKESLNFRYEQAAQTAAEILPNLSAISFSYANDRNFGFLKENVVWTRFEICSSLSGESKHEAIWHSYRSTVDN